MGKQPDLTKLLQNVNFFKAEKHLLNQKNVNRRNQELDAERLQTCGTFTKGRLF